MPVTVRGTDILFNDGSTQSTAAGSSVPATLGAIGTVMSAGHTSTSNIPVGATIAGSSLYYQSNTTNWAFPFRSEGTGGIPQTTYIYNNNPEIQRISNGNTGFTVPGGSTALAGTWRNVGYAARARTSAFDGVYGVTFSSSFISFWVRIS